MRRLIYFALVAVMGVASMSWAQNIPSRTLGGSQFWTDYFIYGEWRIQQHAVTGHHRLLDDKNVRQAWGSYQYCRDRFDQIKQNGDLPALKETVVVTIHGLGRTRRAMQELADEVGTAGDWTPINVSYASTRKGVADHAGALTHLLDSLEGVKTVHLVGHSLGNIVIRRCLADRDMVSGAEAMPRIGRIVMLAPPNCGSSVARIVQENKLFEWFGGTAGQELGGAWKRLEPHLATPDDFAVIAGSTRDGKGSNPLIPGDDDLIVGVEETKLAGANDFLVVDSLHTVIMEQDEVIKATASYLRHGYFVSAQRRMPIREMPADQQEE